MKKEMHETIQKITEDLLDHLGIPATITVSEDEDDAVMVHIQTDETGVLIGHHGKALNAFQTVLGHMVYKQLGEWVRLVVDVGDYRLRRKQQLEELATRWAEQALSQNEAIAVTDLIPYERRIIHLFFAHHPDVMSESTGEGRNRRLIIKRREQSETMTADDYVEVQE